MESEGVRGTDEGVNVALIERGGGLVRMRPQGVV
jgi:hypothetical protein